MPKDQSDKKFSVAKSRASEHAHELDQIGDDYLRQFISLRELSQLAEITSTAKSRQAWLDSIDVGMLDDQDKKEFNEFIKNLITAFATTIGIEVRDPKSGEV